MAIECGLSGVEGESKGRLFVACVYAYLKDIIDCLNMLVRVCVRVCVCMGVSACNYVC
jgi:hypothetical protein